MHVIYIWKGGNHRITKVNNYISRIATKDHERLAGEKEIRLGDKIRQ